MFFSRLTNSRFGDAKMIRIYDHKTGKLREVILEPGEKQYLCKQNLNAIRKQNAEKERCAEEKD
jgi:hypothetical protein